MEHPPDVKLSGLAAVSLTKVGSVRQTLGRAVVVESGVIHSERLLCLPRYPSFLSRHDIVGRDCCRKADR